MPSIRERSRMIDENIKYNVIIDPAANDRMFDHYKFLAQVSKAASERLLERLIKDISSLEYMPYRNPVYDRPYIQRGKYRYMISCGKYRIVYQIDSNVVFIDDIQDCRQSDNSSLIYEE